MLETSPIEFYRASHTNKDGVMSADVQAAYVSNVQYLQIFCNQQAN
jgi:hypothetical protein